MNKKTIDNGTLGANVRNNINSNFDELYNVGLTSLYNTISLTAQQLTTTAVKIDLAKDIMVETGNSSQFNLANKRIDILKHGVYKLTGTSSVELDSNERLNIKVYKNGVDTTNEIFVSGLGTGKKVTVSFDGFFDLAIGDYIEFFALVEVGTASLIVHSANIALEKTIF